MNNSFHYRYNMKMNKLPKRKRHNNWNMNKLKGRYFNMYHKNVFNLLIEYAFSPSRINTFK